MRTRVSKTDTLLPADVTEWLRIDAGEDSSTVTALIASSLVEVEGYCRKPLYPSSWADRMEPISTVPESIVLPNVFFDPQGLAAEISVGSIPTPLDIKSAYWDKPLAEVAIEFENIPETIDKDSYLQLTWTDTGDADLSSVETARKMLIAKYYDGEDVDLGMTLGSLLQMHMRMM